MVEQEISVKEYLERNYIPPIFTLPHKETKKLPFDSQISWESFERLSVRIAEKKYTTARLYLKQGHKQHGIDIWCSEENPTLIDEDEKNKKIFIQCKKVEKFTANQLKIVVDTFLNGKFSKEANEFILAIKIDFSEKEQLTTEFFKQKDRLAKEGKGIVFNLWDTNVLNSLLRNHPSIVAEIFGTEADYYWVKTCCDDQEIKVWLKTQAQIPDKIKYPKLENYILRKINCEGERSQFSLIFGRPSERNYLYNVIKKSIDRKIVLLSVAGAGKSGELKNLAFAFSNSEESSYPILCNFRNYVDEDIEEFVAASEKDWLNIPETRRLILLDGFDEVHPDKIEFAAKKLNLFSLKYPASTIVVTARSNFYKAQLEQFKVYYLENLREEDIKEYLTNYLSRKDAVLFERVAKKNKVWPLLTNAFNLIEIAELYQTQGKSNFPKSRSEAFGQLIQMKISANQAQHPVKTVDELDYQIEMRKALDRIAISMDQLGVNSLSTDSYRQIITSPSQRELLKHSPLVNTYSKSTSTWQFEHNNYQEFLAANILSKQPFETIKELISFKPNFLKIKPKWVNTISFLIGILDQTDKYKFKQVVEWLLSIEPEIFVKFEREIVPSEARFQSFTTIFETNKKKITYLQYEGLQYQELADLGGNEKRFIQYLHSELKNTSSVEHLSNILYTTSYWQIFHGLEPELKEHLWEIIKSPFPPHVHHIAIDCLFKIGFDDVKEIDEIIKICPNINTILVRESVHAQLLKKNLTDKYIDFLLDSYIVAKAEVTASQIHHTSYYQNKAVKSCTTVDALNKILDFAIKHSKEINEDDFYIYEDELIDEVFVKNCVQAYQKNNGLHDRMEKLVVLYCKRFRDKALEHLRLFFIETGTSLTTLKKWRKRKYDIYDLAMMSSIIVNRECVEYMIKLYPKGKLSDNEIIYFRNLIVNSDLHDFFYTSINYLSNNKYKYHVGVKHEEIRERLHQQDLILLNNKELFLLEAKKVFDILQKNEITEDEILDFKKDDYTEYEDLPHTIVTICLRKMAHPKRTISYDRFYQRYKTEDYWQLYVISTLAQMLQNKKEIGVVHIKYITEWCKKTLDQCDFRTALWPNKQGGLTYKIKENLIQFFWAKIGFELNEATMLDMLSFDHSRVDEYPKKAETTYQTLSGLIVDRLNDDEKVKKRILENLNRGIEVKGVCRNHIMQCKALVIYEATPLILKAIKDDQLDDYDKVMAAKIYIDLGGDWDELLIHTLSLNCQSDWHWSFFELTYSTFSTEINAHIEGCFLNGITSIDHKLKAIPYLLSTGNEAAFEFIMEWLHLDNGYSWGLRSDFDLTKYEPTKVLENLFDLLLLSYKKGTNTDGRMDLKDNILAMLWRYSLPNDTAFMMLIETIPNFIEKNRVLYSAISELYNWVRRLEREYYLNKGETHNIKEIIKFTDKLMLS